MRLILYEFRSDQEEVRAVDGRERRRRVTAVLEALRDLRTELAVYSHRVGARVELKDLDFDCLDVIARHGPIGPTALAARVGVHAATMTGVLSRLEAGGWIRRVPVEDDRRAVRVTSTPERQRDRFAVLGGMQTRMGEICEGYTDEQLATIADFLGRTVEAGRTSAAELG
jgi:DNA-binding MarR family transcriptional regulator